MQESRHLIYRAGAPNARKLSSGSPGILYSDSENPSENAVRLENSVSVYDGSM